MTATTRQITHVADADQNSDIKFVGGHDRAALFDIQFLNVPGKGERLVVMPESVFRVVEEIFKSRIENGKSFQRVSHLPQHVQLELDRGVDPVRAVRKWRKLSGVKLARMVGISPSMLSQVELHGKSASLDTYVKLSTVLNVPMELLAVKPADDRCTTNR
jgi:hypothetical protein